MAAETRVIVGIGEVLWDMLPSGKVLGGAPANFVYHVAQIGGEEVQPLLVSCVGKDPPRKRNPRALERSWVEPGVHFRGQGPSDGHRQGDD